MQTNTQQIEPGWAVLDVNDDKIGEVSEVGPSYVRITKGMIFQKDVYIPTSEIRSVDPTRQAATLNVARDEIGAMGWDRRPTGTADYGTAGDVADATSSDTTDRRRDPGDRRGEVGADAAGAGAGALGGAAVGGVIGGPVGAAVGGVVGAGVGGAAGEAAEGGAEEPGAAGGAAAGTVAGAALGGAVGGPPGAVVGGAVGAGAGGGVGDQAEEETEEDDLADR